MKNKLSLFYDKEGDFLEIRIGKPAMSYFKNLGNGVFQKREEKTDKITGYSILGFSKRTQNFKELKILLPE